MLFRSNEKNIALMVCDNSPSTDDDFQVLVINSDKDDTKNIHDSEKLENISTNHSVIISDQNKFVEVPDFGDFERLSSEVEIEKRDGMLSGREHLDEKIRLNENQDEEGWVDFENSKSLLPVLTPSSHSHICQTSVEYDSNIEITNHMDDTNENDKDRTVEDENEWSGFGRSEERRVGKECRP